MPAMKQNPSETMVLLKHALLHDFQLVPLCTPESPVFLAIALPTEEGVTGLKPRLPAGRGMTAQQALIGAGAEALELRASLAQRHQDMLAGLPQQDGIAMASARDLMTGQTVLVPAQEIFLDCAATLSEPLMHDADSTGCAAGQTRDDATAAALCECVERDAVALWWHGGLDASALPVELVDARYPRLYWWLHQRERLTRLLDLSTDIGLPVVAAVSSDPDGRFVAVGTAARPQLADAALAAVTEMIQTETSMVHAREAQDPELLLWEAAASVLVQPQFHPVTGKSPTIALREHDLMRRMADLGLRVLAHELTRPGDPLPSMRVIVPGLCAMRAGIATARFHRLATNTAVPCFPEPF